MSLDLDALAERVPLPDDDARQAARAALDSLAKPKGALGKLEELAAWLAAVQGTCPPRPIDRVRVVIFAGDHGIATAGVSAYPAEVTGLMVRTFLAGGAAVNVLADLTGASVRVVDMAVNTDLEGLPADVTRYKVRRGSGRIDVEDALTYDEAVAAFEAGQAIADKEIDSGADLLIPGDMGIGNTTPAAVLTAVLTATDVASTIGRGTGIDDRAWMRKCAAVRDAARRGRTNLGDMIKLLAIIGGADIAAMSGFLVQASIRRTPVILDGVVSTAAALVGQRVSYRTVRWWLAGHRSTEPAQGFALTRLGLTPLVDHELRLGEGTGALMALPAVRAASRLLTDMASLEDVLGSGGGAGPDEPTLQQSNSEEPRLKAPTFEEPAPDTANPGGERG